MGIPHNKLLNFNMNIESIIKLVSAAAIFMTLGWLEAPITNPPPSQEDLNYQKYYKEQSSKPYLSEKEFGELTQRADAMIKEKNISSLLLLKFLFASILALSAFVVSKYLLSSLYKWSGALTILACSVSIVWFVSSFELVIYIVFCAFGALLAQKFNKQFNMDSDAGAPPPVN